MVPSICSGVVINRRYTRHMAEASRRTREDSFAADVVL
jgi:hypothetical protein